MVMCTDAMQTEVNKAACENGLKGHSTVATKKPNIRFSFMGRKVEDLTDESDGDYVSEDESYEDGFENEVDENSQEVDDPVGQSLEEEKRMIRKQLLQISSQLGQLTNSTYELPHCDRLKKKRPNTFPSKKEKDKILSIRISLPQEGKNGSRKRAKSTHASPSTVLSTASLQSFGLKLGSESETDSVDSSSDKSEKDPMNALQGIASATPTACNGIGNSRQHNNEAVISSGLVASFQLPAWRLAPEIDLPQYRVIQDYGDDDPHFGPGYNFLSGSWAKGRINFDQPSNKRRKTSKSMGPEEIEDSIYQKSYRTSKRRSSTGSEIEDTSDDVYKKLHHSQEKAEKERMTSLYNKRLKDTRDDRGDPLKCGGLSSHKV